MHAKRASGQFIHAADTYKAEVMTQIDQISYLLTGSLACPIYKLSGVSPGDSPPV